ncbi:unnamed protein product [Chironomus riparius]|uniref:Tetratricopeptide repeat protein 36 n=1 Tax=Chironomus riparius TaxID=315576 RepID=A0A9N9RWB3_9DIPT|nr:unnamed protein product [Chironomus riparius]
MSASGTKEISARDLQILDLLFDQSKSEDLVRNCTQPIHDDINIKDDDEEITEEITSSKKYEIEGVVLAEAAKFDEALEKFNKAIEAAPNRPSPYNNRAQLFRFLKDDEKTISDLNKAIELSGDKYKLTKCRAYTQRGIIHRMQNNLDAARDDFNESAKLGSKFSRQQLVDINPYAQLCNQMVTQILGNYQNY